MKAPGFGPMVERSDALSISRKAKSAVVQSWPGSLTDISEWMVLDTDYNPTDM